jgi:UV DNA damage repair endonuclease
MFLIKCSLLSSDIIFKALNQATFEKKLESITRQIIRNLTNMVRFFFSHTIDCTRVSCMMIELDYLFEASI